MEDGQDHQDGGDLEAGLAATPSAEPPGESKGEAAAQDAARADATSDGPDDVSSLTGVLAALEEPEPEESALPELAAIETDSSHSALEDDDEIAALQATLEADADAEETVASELEAEPVVAAEPEAAAAESAPTAVAGAQETPHVAVEPSFVPDDRRGVPIWPFLVYFGIWIVFAGLLVWQFLQAPSGVPLYELALYGPSILVGLVLTALGPLLAIGVWFVVWLVRPGARSGLFSRSLIIGAVVTLAGVALWLIALGAADMLRLGRLI